MSLKILVIDDDPTTQQLLRALAIPSGHLVSAFDDSAAALAQLDVRAYDLAFVATRIRHANGLETIHSLRQSDYCRDTFIVLLNASDAIESMRAAFAEGADLAITKPLSAGPLRGLLAAADSPGWKNKRHSARLPLFTDVHFVCGDQKLTLRSLNISESGILLQGTADAEVGAEVELSFAIAEVSASLHIRGRIARKEGNDGYDRLAVEFHAVTPEAQNAIELYVLGRMKDLSRPREIPGIAKRRPTHPV